MTILNLGCGTKTSSDPGVINIDWSIYLRLKRQPLLFALAYRLLSDERRKRLRNLPDNILVHDLSKGIPFETGSVDAVYHSHLLEHLDREVAPRFLEECWRVLQPGGVLRIVVPDLESACRSYLTNLKRSLTDPAAAACHDAFLVPILEQSVRRMGAGTSQQTPLRRFIEWMVVGDARRRGETHQWMYDRVNLGELLRACGFPEPLLQNHRSSQIPGWGRLGLDLDETGGEYKPGSLYIEGVKPES